MMFSLWWIGSRTTDGGVWYDSAFTVNATQTLREIMSDLRYKYRIKNERIDSAYQEYRTHPLLFEIVIGLSDRYAENKKRLKINSRKKGDSMDEHSLLQW